LRIAGHTLIRQHSKTAVHLDGNLTRRVVQIPGSVTSGALTG